MTLRRRACTFALAAAAALPGGPLRADEPTATPSDGPATSEPKDGPRRVGVSGFVDVVYAYGFNEPADRAHFYPGVGTNAKRHDEFSLNLANLELALDPEPVGFRLTLAAGVAADIVHAAEGRGPGVGPDVWRHVQYATVAYKAPVGRGLLLEGGIYPCHVGYESLPSKDNWNVTRSWLGELSPYYVTGVKATYAFDDHWSAGLHLVNGWQNVAETNGSKTLGTQLGWATTKASVSFNTLIGRELPDDEDWRVFGDLLVTVHATPKLSVGAQVDAAREGRPGDSSASWWGLAGYLRYQLAPRWAIALRGDHFDDEEGAISGFAQRLNGATATLELKPAPAMLLRLEGRQDWSTREVFASDQVGPDGLPRGKRREFILLVSAVASF